MTCKEIIKYLEYWAPKGAAWAKDNPGLQVGSESRELRNIFLCLELTDDALNEAVRQKCNFIFTHHPLIFQPFRKINSDTDRTSRLLEQLIKNDITLYSAHTNLDFTHQGVSFQLARKLNLTGIRFLRNQDGNQLKLTVFVPHNDLAKVSDAIFAAGGGIIGNYEACSFSSEGYGTFRGNQYSNPAAGTAGNLETVAESRLEVLVDSWKINTVVSSMLKVHPYEQPAYDIYPLNSPNANYGFGAIGTLPGPADKKEFLSLVSESLGSECLKYSGGDSTRPVSRVAVCGGSGSDLLDAAVAAGADAFVTADIKYHTFFDALDSGILLVDAGHYETEVVVLSEVKRRIEELTASNDPEIKVYIYNNTTNPVKCFNKFKE